MEGRPAGTKAGWPTHDEWTLSVMSFNDTEARELRRLLGVLIRAAREAADPQKIVHEALQSEATTEGPAPAGPAPGEPAPGEPASHPRAGNSTAATRPALLLGFGKAALGMARGALEAGRTASDRSSSLGAAQEAGADGLVVVPVSAAPADQEGLPGQAPIPNPGGPQAAAPLGRLEILQGSHPIPTAASVHAARQLAGRARAARAERRPVLALISGGASALLTLPPEGVALESIAWVTRELMHRGADIEALNRVRKHLDQLKGGGLARMLAPVPVRGLVISDVAGDSLTAIASGPLSPDPSTFQDAIEVLRAHRLWTASPPDIRTHLQEGATERRPETPGPGDRCFDHVRLRIVGSGRTVAEAVVRQATELGLAAELGDAALTGEAREVGRALSEHARSIQRTAQSARVSAGRPSPVRCLVYAGETTVTVRGPGRGGRNQELALSAALALDGTRGIALCSFGTDGIDGPTDAAGAIATGTTLARLEDAGLSAPRLLEENDSYRAFAAIGDHVRTGPTGTNMMDLQIVLVAPRGVHPPV